MSRRVQAVMVGAVLVAAFGAAGCGGGGKPGVGSAEGNVKQNWLAFFSGSTPAAKKIQLLQNGKQFVRLIEAQSSSPLAQQSKARVSSVTVNGSQATVKYTIFLAGKPALKNQTGTAVKTGNTWQVSDKSFCALLALQGSPPPACRG